MIDGNRSPGLYINIFLLLEILLDHFPFRLREQKEGILEQAYSDSLPKKAFSC